jgi:hypothetical protein
MMGCVNPEVWVGLGFVASTENAHVEPILEMGCIRIVCPQIAWGTGYPRIDPNLDHVRRLFDDCRRVGLGTAGWAWCNGEDVEGEARHHASIVLNLGLTKFVANQEEPYDAHGDVNSPRWEMANSYARVFRSIVPDGVVELGLTTTPRWASDGTGMREAGATIMPQAFTGEVPEATIPMAHQHALAWGWPVERQRHLVQTYTTGGVYPDPAIYVRDSALCGVGCIPYILEQADMAGIKTMESAILRVPAPVAPPEPPPPPAPAPLPPSKLRPPTLPFQRSLFPPSAAAKGHVPSKPGHDVRAVKRALSRAGYWPWVKGGKFTQDYTNLFAQKAVAVFQDKNVAVMSTGWYGPRTHEALRQHRIRRGLPNAGEFAFDKTAQALYKRAP